MHRGDLRANTDATSTANPTAHVRANPSCAMLTPTPQSTVSHRLLMLCSRPQRAHNEPRTTSCSKRPCFGWSSLAKQGMHRRPVYPGSRSAIAIQHSLSSADPSERTAGGLTASVRPQQNPPFVWPVLGSVFETPWLFGFSWRFGFCGFSIEPANRQKRKTKSPRIANESPTKNQRKTSE